MFSPSLKQLSEKTEIKCDELVATRKSVKEAIQPYFIDNKKIFDTYGPMTEERFNPESEMPEIWLREGANKRGNSSRLTQSFHFFMFEPIFSPVNALNQPT